MCSARRHVRFTPRSGHVQCNSVCPLCANSGHSAIHSITSSAAKRIPLGMVIPSALAVLRLTTNSNFVGCSIGQFGRFRTFQNSCHVVRDSTPQQRKVDAIGHINPPQIVSLLNFYALGHSSAGAPGCRGGVSDTPSCVVCVGQPY